LGAKFLVLSTPESVNTPIGIARWILGNVNESVQIIIVEMGEHYKGDILELCELAPPDVAVVTGVNEAHLERMKNLETTALTIFEIVERLRPKGYLLVNSDNEYAKSYYEEIVKKFDKTSGEKINMEYFSSNQEITEKKFDQYDLCWQFDCGDIRGCRIFLLGEYAVGMAAAAAKLGKYFNLSEAEIKMGLERVRPIRHRLEPTLAPGGILVIDDAYNGNSDGAKEAMRILARFANRRKIYLTPGLVETGPMAREVHMDIGKQLASVADVVILIRNSVTQDIELGIMNYELGGARKKPEIIWFNTAPQAHAALKDIVEPNDVILFQNDWGDQYT